jgi:hypothetical protein
VVARDTASGTLRAGHVMTVGWTEPGAGPEWTDEPARTGQLLTDRARSWGWAPGVSLARALDELLQGLTTPA